MNAAFARLPAAPSASSKVMLSSVPFTDARSTAGRTPSTFWLAFAATAVCVSVAAVAPSALRTMVLPPWFASAFASTAIPSLSASPRPPCS